jgi:competence protein ComEC
MQMFFRTRWTRVASIVAIFLLLISLAGCGEKAVERGNKAQNLKITVIDVGQGDSILIRTPSKTTLIDTGDLPARDKLISYIKSQGISTIDNLIITHPHSDHLGGAAAVLDSFTVKQVYDSGQAVGSSLQRQFLNKIKQKNIAFQVLAAGDQVDIGGGAAYKILAPEKPPISGTDSDINNNSIVAKLIYGSFSMLLTGDAEQEEEARLLKSYGTELKSTVLKVGHHGSHTSSSPAFLKAVSPEIAVISVGANNEYHHPHPSTLKKYREAKIDVIRTDLAGSITITADGKAYSIVKEK